MKGEMLRVFSIEETGQTRLLQVHAQLPTVLRLGAVCCSQHFYPAAPVLHCAFSNTLGRALPQVCKQDPGMLERWRLRPAWEGP